MAGSPVEKPVSASSGSRDSGAYREKKPGNPARKTLLPNVPSYGLYAVSGMRAKCSAVIKHLPADMGHPVSEVGKKNLCLRKTSVTLSYWKYSHRASLEVTAAGHRYRRAPSHGIPCPRLPPASTPEHNNLMPPVSSSNIQAKTWFTVSAVNL